MIRVTSIIFALFLAMAGSAAAQDSGVVYDDDSPAAKEYAVPLDDARGVGNGGDQGGPSTAPTTPPSDPGTPAQAPDAALFGSGIEETSANRPSGDGRGSQRPDKPSRGRSETPSGAADTGAAQPEQKPIRTVAADAGSSQLQLALIVAVVALAAAALGGLIARRSRRA